MPDQDTTYWHGEATKFAQLLSEKELALNTSQVEAMQLQQRIAELEKNFRKQIAFYRTGDASPEQVCLFMVGIADSVLKAKEGE